MLEHDGGSDLPGFDQDMSAEAGDYASWSSGEALAMFRMLREANLRMFEHLTPPSSGANEASVWERGKMTVANCARTWQAHDINHIEQARGDPPGALQKK